MKVHLYTISLNEADMLGFFFRHFDPWVDRYVVFDDGSTDGTLECGRVFFLNSLVKIVILGHS